LGLYRADGNWYGAVVVRRSGKAYTVQWDDGDPADTVKTAAQLKTAAPQLKMAASKSRPSSARASSPGAAKNRSASKNGSVSQGGRGARAPARGRGDNSTWASVKQLLLTPGLGTLTAIKLVYQIFVSAGYTFAAKYVSEKYHLEPHHMGYLSSYQSVVSLVSQTYLVGAISQRFGTERTLQLSFFVMVVLALWEGAFRSVYLYVAIVPFRTVAGDLISQMFETMMTAIVPQSEAASLFGTLNLLKAAARVGGPIYGGLLFSYCGKELGLYARPAVESSHNAIILALLLSAYPLLHSSMLPRK